MTVMCVQLEGAALNTAVLLNPLHMIGCPTTTPPHDINPNKPNIQTAAFKVRESDIVK
jgi:hypothetical protein